MAKTSLHERLEVGFFNLYIEQVGNESGLIMLDTNSKEEMVSNAKRQRLTTLLDANCLRAATMLWMALGDDARRKSTEHSILALAQTTFYHCHIGMTLRSRSGSRGSVDWVASQPPLEKPTIKIWGQTSDNL